MNFRLILSFLFIIMVTSCSKEDRDCDNPIDCLPEATQAGANTAGCLIDGEILIPEGEQFMSESVLKAQYFKEELVFGLSIIDRKDNERYVSIEIRDIILEEGKTYKLMDQSDGIFGGYLTEDFTAFITNDIYTGEITISKLDESLNIISGTFWFDGISRDGDLIECRSGRFDVQYYGY